MSTSTSLKIRRSRSGVNDHHSSSSIWSVTEALLLLSVAGASAVSRCRCSVELVRWCDGASSGPCGVGGVVRWCDGASSGLCGVGGNGGGVVSDDMLLVFV